ncbi:ABC transporter permease [Candidatus Bathyarchaeota archaeon]|nr:MAG: ABC transporter permease [Candidatus Bathyarchaeota archaeon]RLI19580.1 MAG: ABC transporter permease [Candidatus Bathyarchaeota archaeon]RLI27794.1 MAG: ABC transporter permease [Candidatus Bathyarchaeota archaeon]
MKTGIFNKSTSRFFLQAIIVFAVFMSLLLLWEAISFFGILNPSLISRPSEIFLDMWKLFLKRSPAAQSVLLVHIYSSLYRLFLAFSLAAGVGISLGILMGYSQRIRWFLEPLITLAMPVPGIAWAPIFMIWFGFGDPTIISVGALAAFFPIVYNTTTGVRSIEKEFIWAARSMGADRKTIFFKVLLPSSAPYIFTGFKLGLARGWRTIIAVEMIAASLWGLGFMIFDARDYLRPSIIYGGIIILAVVYLFIEGLVKLVERRTIAKWGMVRPEAM